jgi:hypothetical protein
VPLSVALRFMVQAAAHMPAVRNRKSEVTMTATKHFVTWPLSAASGWYRDPWKKAGMRYWDGQHWTGYTDQSPASRQVSQVDLRYDWAGTRLRGMAQSS